MKGAVNFVLLSSDTHFIVRECRLLRLPSKPQKPRSLVPHNPLIPLSQHPKFRFLYVKLDSLPIAKFKRRVEPRLVTAKQWYLSLSH